MCKWVIFLPTFFSADLFLTHMVLPYTWRQRRIQNPDRHLRWRFFAKVIKSSILDFWLSSECNSRPDRTYYLSYYLIIQCKNIKADKELALVKIWITAVSKWKNQIELDQYVCLFIQKNILSKCSAIKTVSSLRSIPTELYIQLHHWKNAKAIFRIFLQFQRGKPS